MSLFYSKKTKKRIPNYSFFGNKDDRMRFGNPFGDRDRDGVPNAFDCRPLNRKRQDNPNNPLTLSNELKDKVKNPLEFKQHQHELSQKQIKLIKERGRLEDLERELKIRELEKKERKADLERKDTTDDIDMRRAKRKDDEKEFNRYGQGSEWREF